MKPVAPVLVLLAWGWFERLRLEGRAYRKRFGGILMLYLGIQRCST